MDELLEWMMKCWSTFVKGIVCLNSPLKLCFWTMSFAKTARCHQSARIWQPPDSNELMKTQTPVVLYSDEDSRHTWIPLKRMLMSPQVILIVHHIHLGFSCRRSASKFVYTPRSLPSFQSPKKLIIDIIQVWTSFCTFSASKTLSSSHMKPKILKHFTMLSSDTVFQQAFQFTPCNAFNFSPFDAELPSSSCATM